MDVRDLSRGQLVQLKQRYLFELVDEGTFAGVLGVDYDEPSYADLADADGIVPDDVIFNNYEGVNLVKEDFWLCGSL